MNKNNSVFSGLGLIGLGVIFLVSQYVEFDGRFFLSLLGLGFIGWALLTRKQGLLIPGGILSGIGLGIVLSESAFAVRFEGDMEGSLFFLGFAAGWASIIVLTKLFFNEFQWWPLIPGGIMALIGIGIMTDGVLLDIIGSVGQWWPVILIVIGLSAIWKQFKNDDDDNYEKQPEGWQAG
ncbi:MAG: hypothetical protein AAF902_02465 [Chloroflexota bacterium]